MSDSQRIEAVSSAKSAGFKVASVVKKNGKTEWQLSNAAGATVQLGLSEEDVWLKAYNRGILPELKK